MLKKAETNLSGLFLNADPGFDSADFRQSCQKEEIIPNVKLNPRNSANQETQPYQSGTHIFDDELYRNRSVIEHANAWIDGFKALLVRFEFSVKNCGAARADGFTFYGILSHFFTENQSKKKSLNKLFIKTYSATNLSKENLQNLTVYAKEQDNET